MYTYIYIYIYADTHTYIHIDIHVYARRHICVHRLVIIIVILGWHDICGLRWGTATCHSTLCKAGGGLGLMAPLGQHSWSCL